MTSDLSRGAHATPTTIRQWLLAATHRLKTVGIEQPRAEARSLASLALAMSREALIAHDDRALSPPDLLRLDNVLRRRSRFEPMAYIRGQSEFYGRSFAVTPDVLIPRPETELIVDRALEFIDNKRPFVDEQPAYRGEQPEHLNEKKAVSVLDLGVGSGCIILSILAERPACTGLGVDLSARALAVSRQNARRLGVDDRLNLIQSSWGQALSGLFDIIVSNPPYIDSDQISSLMPDVRNHEPRLALDGGAQGLEPYPTLVQDIQRLLKPDGIALIELGIGQVDAVQSMVAHHGMRAMVEYDLSSIERCLVIRHFNENVRKHSSP